MTGWNSDAEDEGEQLWAMGAVTRRTGISEHTLRAWERRFGFPAPVRLDSGHRRYPVEQVRQLVLIQRALEAGHRAGDVVPLPKEQLRELVRTTNTTGSDAPGELASESAWVGELLEAVRAFDQQRVGSLLDREVAQLGVPAFLRERVGPFLQAVGDAWARDELQVRHEHFASSLLENRLWSLRERLERTARGQPVILACLPDEQHGLGLQVAALAVVSAGRQVRVLGPQLPVEEIARASFEVHAAAVALSISIFSIGEELVERTEAQVDELRELLPSSLPLWLGGAGASALARVPARVEVLRTFDDLDAAVASLPP